MLKVRTGLRWVVILGILLLPACGGHPPKPFSSETIPTEAIAEITEIANRPVWIRLLNTDSEAIGTLGKKIKIGESIRTEGNALVQISLKSGTLIRMEGNSNLTIYADGKIAVTKGEILVWVPPQPNITAKITLSGAIATVKNATVYINSAQIVQILNLEGTTEVLPTGAKTPTLVKAGQNLEIKIEDKKGIKNSHKILSTKDLKTKFAKIKLLSGFNSKIGSQDAIAINLQIPISPTDSIIPINRPAKNPPSKPANPEPTYYQEPYPYYERRAEPVRSEPVRNPEPQISQPVNQDLPPDPVQPELDEPPQPSQPEEPQP